MQARIERAHPADAGEILTVQRAAYVADAQLYGDPFLAPLVESLAQIENAIARADGDGFVLKACLGARIVGAVRARCAGRVGSASRLAVVPDLQGCGIEAALVTATEAALGGGVQTLVLSVGERSVDTLRDLRRLGYTETHRERLAPHLGLVHLRKTL